jgi:hypothetical protein
MRTNLRLLLTLIAMSLGLFLGLIGYQVYRFERDYKLNFLAEKIAFGEQVAQISLAGMQMSNYFEIYRLGNGVYKSESMLYLAIVDDTGQMVHFRAAQDNGKIREARSQVPAQGVQEELRLLDEPVAVVHSPIKDDTGKQWGGVEIAYYWAPAKQLLRNQILRVLPGLRFDLGIGPFLQRPVHTKALRPICRESRTNPIRVAGLPGAIQRSSRSRKSHLGCQRPTQRLADFLTEASRI